MLIVISWLASSTTFQVVALKHRVLVKHFSLAVATIVAEHHRIPQGVLAVIFLGGLFRARGRGARLLAFGLHALGLRGGQCVAICVRLVFLLLAPFFFWYICYFIGKVP